MLSTHDPPLRRPGFELIGTINQQYGAQAYKGIIL